jgi:hypothetical protein
VPVKLVIVGTFTDARYFAVTANDRHYTNTQHLADAWIDVWARKHCRGGALGGG